MRISGIGLRNLKRNRVRVFLTVIGCAIAIVGFILLRTVVTSWGLSADRAAKDRLGVRNKVSIILPLPKHYIDNVREVSGVKDATYMNWFGGKDPRNPGVFFGTMAVDPQSYLAVLDEVVVSPEDRARWLEDRRGALIGDVLARKLNVKVGDRMVLTGSIYPGDWEFSIAAIYTTSRRSVDRSNFLFHWDYLNESIPLQRRDQIGWIVARVDEPERVPVVSAMIDRIFDERETQTTTMSEKAMNLSFMATVSSVLDALDIVAAVVLLIMGMIMGNTIAMGVRERTREYGVMRALGFLPKHVAWFVVGEGLVTGLLAGALGTVVAYPIVELAIGRWVEENIGSMFAYFRIQPVTMVVAVLLAMSLGVVSSVVPAVRASRMHVLQALRQNG